MTNKITEQFGKSRERQQFVNRLGTLFREHLLEDKAMSYPGNNGFSLQQADLDRDQWLMRFLNDAVDYGDLFDAPHTTKLKNRKQRRKWYLNPILSPHFQIPETHVKEPMYVTLQTVKTWLAQVGVIDLSPAEEHTGRRRSSKRTSDRQLSFPPDFTDQTG